MNEISQMSLRRSYWSLWNYWFLIFVCVLALLIPFILTDTFLAFVPINLDPGVLDSYLRKAGLIGLIVSAIAMAYQRLYSRYEIFPDRVEASHGVLSKKVSTADLGHIRSIDVNKSLAGMLLGYGNLLLGTAGTGESNVTMIAVDEPAKVRDHLRMLIRGESGTDAKPEPSHPSPQPFPLVTEQPSISMSEKDDAPLIHQRMDQLGSLDALNGSNDQLQTVVDESEKVDSAIFKLSTDALYAELERRMREVENTLPSTTQEK